MPTTHPPGIRIAGRHKSFTDNHVLRGIDLDLPPGIVFALLGANGAGKTTAINILTTLLTPDAGTVRVAGYDVVGEADKVRASIGVTGQFAAVDGLLTGEENLRMMARLVHLDPGAPRPAPPTCSNSSTSPRWRGSRPPPIPAACVAAWTWPCR
jgi:ABC-2 type transport system ATP-binding protein